MRLNITQAARVAGASRMTVHRLIKRGKVHLLKGGLVNLAQLGKALRDGRNMRPVLYRLDAIPDNTRIMALLIRAALSDCADFDFMAYTVRQVIENNSMFIGHLLNAPNEINTFSRWVAWRVHQLAKDCPNVSPTWSRVVKVLMNLPFKTHMVIEYDASKKTAVIKSMPDWLDEKPDSIRRVPLDSSRASFSPTKARKLQVSLNTLWGSICAGSFPDHTDEYALALGGLINGNLTVEKASRQLSEISGIPNEQVRAALRPFLAERNRYMARTSQYDDDVAIDSEEFDYDAIDKALGWKEPTRSNESPKSRNVVSRGVPVAVVARALGVSRLTVRRWAR